MVDNQVQDKELQKGTEQKETKKHICKEGTYDTLSTSKKNQAKNETNEERALREFMEELHKDGVKQVTIKGKTDDISIERKSYIQFTEVKIKQMEVNKKIEEVQNDNKYSYAYKKQKINEYKEELIQTKNKAYEKAMKMVNNEREKRIAERSKPILKGNDRIIELLEQNQKLTYLNNILSSNIDPSVINEFIEENKDDKIILNIVKANTSNDKILDTVYRIESEQKNIDKDLDIIVDKLNMVQNNKGVICVGVEQYVDRMIIESL